MDKELLAIIAFLMAAFGLFVFVVYKDEQRLKQSYLECVEQGNTKYACDAYVNSERASRNSVMAIGFAAGAFSGRR